MLCEYVFATYRPQNTPAELNNSTRKSGNTDSTDQRRRCLSETVVIDIKFDVMHDNSISLDLACFYL